MDYKEAVRYGILMGVIFALFDGGLIYDVVVSWGDLSIVWKSALVVIDTVIAVLYFKSAVSAHKKNKKLLEKIAELRKVDDVIQDHLDGKLTYNEACERIGLKRIEDGNFVKINTERTSNDE